MLSNIVRWVIDRRWLVVLATVIISFWTFYIIPQMPLDVLPAFAPPQVEIQAEAPGLAPEEVESLVTLPIESAINGTPGVTAVRSSSAAGISAVRVIFNQNTEIYQARQLVTKRLQQATSKLPPGVETPQISPTTSPVGLVVQYAFTVEETKSSSINSTSNSTFLTPNSLTLLNAAFLLIVSGGIGWEAIQRFREPAPVARETVIIVAAIGIAINTISAMMFLSGRKNDLNIRGAFLHLVADAAVSVGVVLGGIAIVTTGWLWFDPAVSLIVTIVIVAGTWGLLSESFNLITDAVPAGIEPLAVRTYLAELPGVTGVHDLHIRAMITTETALTVHNASIIASSQVRRKQTRTVDGYTFLARA
jgi:AcrB/AcrD/AcrF family/Cation efflux family